MGFWIFMLIMDLLIPVMMIAIGKRFVKRPPKEINFLLGYRTRMSMKNNETWAFAHTYCGKLWYAFGWVLMLVAIACLLAVIGQNEDRVGTVGSIVCIAQLVPLIVSIFLTEAALKKTFDENGDRR